MTGLLPFVGIFGVLLGATLPLRIHSPRPFLVVPGVMVILGWIRILRLGQRPGYLRWSGVAGVGVLALRAHIACPFYQLGRWSSRTSGHRLGCVNHLFGVCHVCVARFGWFPEGCLGVLLSWVSHFLGGRVDVVDHRTVYLHGRPKEANPGREGLSDRGKEQPFKDLPGSVVIVWPGLGQCDQLWC